ncbi:MAG: HAD family hydrolase [Bacillota bacterium]|nr:HAD family hydrolase [Bacillota bacterium]
MNTNAFNRKLIVSDIDGTFLKSDRSLHEENVAAVRALTAKGHCFALATGRIYGTARMIAYMMGEDFYIISNNGAAIRHTAESAPLYEHTMSRALLEQIYRVAERHDYGYQVYTDMEMVTARPNPFLGKYIDELKQLPEEMRYVVDMNGDPRKVEGIRKVAYTFYYKQPTNELMSDLRAIPGITVAQSHRFGIDISSEDVHKGSALKRLARHLGIADRDTVAFGDEDNDEVLLRAAGLGIAMGNATEATRRAAAFITKTNDEAGFAYALRELGFI